MQANCTSITFPNPNNFDYSPSDTCWRSVASIHDHAMPKWSTIVASPHDIQNANQLRDHEHQPEKWGGKAATGLSCGPSSDCTPICMLVASWRKAKLSEELDWPW